MPIRIITVEREYGSGGALIAKALADHVGWKLWDEELSGEIARVAQVIHPKRATATSASTPFSTASSASMPVAATSALYPSAGESAL